MAFGKLYVSQFVNVQTRAVTPKPLICASPICVENVRNAGIPRDKKKTYREISRELNKKGKDCTVLQIKPTNL